MGYGSEVNVLLLDSVFDLLPDVNYLLDALEKYFLEICDLSEEGVGHPI